MERRRNPVLELAHVVAALLRPAGRSLRENTGLAVLSVVLAFGLWIFVTDAENPSRTRILQDDIVVEPVNEGPSVVVANDLAVVRVRIRVEEEVFDSLSASDFEATVDLEGLTVGEYRLPVDVRPLTARGGLRVEAVLPPEIDVSLVPLETKDVPVEVALEGEPAAGYTLGAVEIETEEVRVFGPKASVDQVANAVASLNVAGRTQPFDQGVRLEPRDARGNLVEKITVDPAVVEVAVEIEQTTFSRPVAVIPQVVGVPADGYNVTSVSARPATVTISGEQAAISQVASISTQPVNVDDADGDVVKSVSLDLPPGISVTGSPNITVTVAIKPARGTVRFVVPVQAKGLGSGLAVKGGLPSVEVDVTGPVPDLLKLEAADVSASVNLEGKDAGTHNLKVEVALPADVGEVTTTVRPDEIEVVLVQA